MIAVLTAVLGVSCLSLSLVFAVLALGAALPDGRGPVRTALALGCSVGLYVAASAVFKWGGW